MIRTDLRENFLVGFVKSANLFPIERVEQIKFGRVERGFGRENAEKPFVR